MTETGSAQNEGNLSDLLVEHNVKYKTKLSTSATFHHYSVSASEIEIAFGLKPVRSHSIGESRPYGDKLAYKDSYCYFDLAFPKKNDVEDLISFCLEALNPSCPKIDQLINTGGNLRIIIKLFDPKFIQLSLSYDLISKLHMANVGLVFENHI